MSRTTMNDSLSPKFGHDLWFVPELYAGQKRNTGNGEIDKPKTLCYIYYSGVTRILPGIQWNCRWTSAPLWWWWPCTLNTMEWDKCHSWRMLRSDPHRCHIHWSSCETFVPSRCVRTMAIGDYSCCTIWAWSGHSLTQNSIDNVSPV